jgi:hypothetical protein
MPLNVNDVRYLKTTTPYNKVVISAVLHQQIRNYFVDNQPHFSDTSLKYKCHRVLKNGELELWGWDEDSFPEDDFLTRQQFIDQFGTDPEALY